MAQTSLRIRAVWSASLLFTNWIVSHLNLLQARRQYSIWSLWLRRLVLVWSYRQPWRQVLSHRCSYMHLYSCKCGPNLQTCFMWYAHRKCLAPLDYSWPIPPMTNAYGIRTKNNTRSPSAPMNTPFSSGRSVGIKRTFFIKMRVQPKHRYVIGTQWGGSFEHPQQI